jgi:hypothetical protein
MLRTTTLQTDTTSFRATEADPWWPRPSAEDRRDPNLRGRESDERKADWRQHETADLTIRSDSCERAGRNLALEGRSPDRSPKR